MYSKKNFPNQKPDEKIIFFLRRHWIAVFRIFLLAFALLLIPLTFYLMVGQNLNFENNPLYYSLYVLVNSSYLLFVILLIFTNFIDYYLDVWIVTNKRIINIEQKGLFARYVSEKDLSRMQDITSEVKGFWATIFHYGNVYIQTAGEKHRFNFKQVPDAAEVTRKISNLVSEYRKVFPEEMKVIDSDKK